MAPVTACQQAAEASEVAMRFAIDAAAAHAQFADGAWQLIAAAVPAATVTIAAATIGAADTLMPWADGRQRVDAQHDEHSWFHF